MESDGAFCPTDIILGEQWYLLSLLLEGCHESLCDHFCDPLSIVVVDTWPGEWGIAAATTGAAAFVVVAGTAAVHVDRGELG